MALYQNPDPYDENEWVGETEFNMSNNSSKEKLLFEQLLGSFHSMPQADSAGRVTDNEEQWLALNNVVDKLASLGHTDYSEMKIQPHRGSFNGRPRQTVSITSLRMKTMAVLRMMSRQFGLTDPGYELSRYGAAGGVNVSQTASPSANSYSHAEARASAQIEIDKLSFALGAILEEKDKEKVAPALEELKQDPSKENVNKLINLLKGLGSAAGNAALSVVAEMALKIALGLPPI